MRLLTLNIRFGAGNDFPNKYGYDVPVSDKKIATLSAAIESVHPDIVALQEVKSQRQAQKIASHLNLQYIYCRHPSGYALDFFEWGIAFLFRPKLIRSVGFSVFFDDDLRSGRQALLATFQIQDSLVTVFNLHLVPHSMDCQIQKVLTMADQGNIPTIIMGDFNCTSGNSSLDWLNYKWLDTCLAAIDTPGGAEADSVGTIPGSSKRIDYIFIEKDRFNILEVGLIPEPYRGISDHIGYFAEVVPT